MVDDAYNQWLASPYGQVHEQAAKSKQQKQQSPTWVNNPYKLLDADDILYPDGLMRAHKRILSRAATLFRSSWNMRHTTRFELDESSQPAFGRDVERDALLIVLEKSLSNFVRAKHTVKQTQAVILERQALAIGKSPITYIASQLGIAKSSASRRLKKAKSATNDRYFGIIELERKAKKDLQRYCCWCEQPTPNGLRALCDDCEARFFYYGNYPPNLTPERLQKLISRSNADHWNEALKAA